MAKNVVIMYQSVAELSAALDTMPIKEAWKKDTIFSNTEKWLKDWCGETPTDARKKFDTGDIDNARKIKAEGEILNEAKGGMMPKIELGVYGCIPSVPNYLRGVPTNMMRVVREPRRNPVIDIFVENSIYDGIDTKKVAQKAAIIANVITATEMAGVRVNLWTVNTADDCSGDKYACIVKIKDAQSPLNLLNIAFPCCNRAMHRSIFLMWLERMSDKRLSGYGRPMKGKEVEKEFNLDGVVLSMRDMVDNGWGIENVTNKINEYLKTK